MSNAQSKKTVSNTSHAESIASTFKLSSDEPRRRTSSTSSFAQQVVQSPSTVGSKTPLTPERSPSLLPTRKRNASFFEDGCRRATSINTALADDRRSSGDSILHVCICQRDPKIPRPRNAFILYRQHHQAHVVAQNPGLANPEISKIIGEQWQSQPIEVKDKWKALAEEEKLRHQQQHPTYRYQPKRSGRRTSLNLEGGSSVEGKSRCHKCGGRTTLAAVTDSDKAANTPILNTAQFQPELTAASVSRALPALGDLSLQTPVTQHAGRLNDDSMKAVHGPADMRDEMAPLSPNGKRRRFNNAPTLTRVMTGRYAAPQPAAATPGVPGTPFHYGQPLTHPFPTAMSHSRHEDLPGIRGIMSSPTTMAPPPPLRPVVGYQQHRALQGRASVDRSLTLPPLKPRQNQAVQELKSARNKPLSIPEQIMGIDFRYKLKILKQVAPPMPVLKSKPRGPFIAIEGDDWHSVHRLGAWLRDELIKGYSLSVIHLDEPVVSADGQKESIMANYHRLVATWLEKSSGIREALSVQVGVSKDTAMADTSPQSAPRTAGFATKSGDEKGVAQGEECLEKPCSKHDGPDEHPRTSIKSAHKLDESSHASACTAHRDTHSSAAVAAASAADVLRPVAIVANYSLHASNFYACNVPILEHDPYSPSDHWQWTATQWRGVMSPDLTIYVRDTPSGDSSARPVLEFMDGGSLCVVRRTKVDGSGGLELEPSSLRRLGFEVSEWVRAFLP